MKIINVFTRYRREIEGTGTDFNRIGNLIPIAESACRGRRLDLI
jgi:hypothetical protein